MLTTDESEPFMRDGPGTPMGEVMRRNWQPVGCSELVTSKPQSSFVTRTGVPKPGPFAVKA